MTAPTIPASESVRQKQPAQQSNQPEQPRRKHDRLITRDMALVMLATFCFMSSNMLANPIVAGYAESLGADGMLMGAVAGSMSFISLFCRPIAGNLSDKTSKRTLVAVGTVLYFAAGLLYYFANSPIMLIMARVINGVGFACCSVCLATWMSLLLPIRHMGAGMGLYGTMNALAMASDRHWVFARKIHRLSSDVFEFAGAGGDHAARHTDGEEWRTAGTQKADFHNGESLHCRRH